MLVHINPYTHKPVRKDGFITFLEGATGHGKTTWIQDYISKVPLPKFGLDISGEYAKFGIKQTNLPPVKDAIINAANEFKYKMLNKWESVIIFSEAGIYFKNKKQMDYEISLILKEARKRGNWIFMDFHKLSEIPIDMLALSDKLVMKKATMETLPQIKKFFHYPEIKEKYIAVMDSTNKYATEIVHTKKLTINIK